jgi:NAD(P)H dehydrogenase (quinone)
MHMTVVVTAAAGPLGRAILERLLAHGTEPSLLVATDRPASGLGSLDPLGVVTVAANTEDPFSLGAVLDGAQTLVYVPTDRPDRRVAEATAVVGAATRAGIAWIVLVGTLSSATSAAGDPAAQRFPEDAVRASGVPFTIVRLGAVTEDFLPVLHQADRSNELVAAWGEGQVASAPVEDYAEAVARIVGASGYEGRVLELTGDPAWSGEDFAAAATEVLGRQITYARRTQDERPIDLDAAGLPPERAAATLAHETAIRDGALAATSHELAALLGRPTTPLAEALRIAAAREAQLTRPGGSTTLQRPNRLA